METGELVAKTMAAAIAPVFMISAVAVLLTCMAARYARVLDRTRDLLTNGKKIYGKVTQQHYLEKEIADLYTRAKLLRMTIIFATASILFIVMAVLLLFLNLRYLFPFGEVAELCFSLALLILATSVLLFIEDFAISLRSLKEDISTRGFPEAVAPTTEEVPAGKSS